MLRSQLMVLMGLLLSISAFAQGTIRGKITDAENGDEVPFANVSIKNTSIGATANFTGDYELTNVPAGQQTIVVTNVSYNTKEVPVDVKDGEVMVLNISLGAGAVLITGITIEEKADRRDDSYMKKAQINSPSTLDFISGNQMGLIGVGSADEALKRVPGVSTVGNFVFVRGLSDRYLKTTLNGAEVPSINPRRNSLEMDIFPTNLIDNLIIVKTQQANLPSDWGGAYMSVETRDFPTEFTFRYKSSFGYNDRATGEDIITSRRSDTDWLGFDDGFRDAPSIAADAVGNFPTIEEVCFYDALVFGGFESDLSEMGITSCGDIGPLGVMSITEVLANIEEIENTEELITDYLQPLGTQRNQELTDINQAFSNTWENERRVAPIDMSHSLSFGNQGKFLGRRIGYIFGAQYNRSTRYYNDGVYGRYAPGIPEISDSLGVQQLFS
ncbi:MAG: carboxypeptidase-like regulatory domain-containing protein, partial [Flavobacteriales bacterium]|nr:carboxypeptidase-like regulatory domain-containing protein [Flavobacteriales bacterium]